jgi:WD40 repeat protein
VAFSPDGRTLASGSFDGTIILWDVADGRNTGALAGHARLHSMLTYSPDGRTIAAGGDDGTIHRWDVATGQRSDLLGFHDGGVRAVAYSPDGRLLGSAGLDGSVQVFDAATGRRRHRFAGNNNRTAVAFRPDGRVIAAGCDVPGPSVRFWDVDTGEPLPPLTGHIGHVGDVTYHPLGRLLATGSWDCTARIWDLADQSSRVFPVGQKPGASVHRVSVAWSPDGRYLAAARERRYVCLFRIAAP